MPTAGTINFARELSAEEIVPVRTQRVTAIDTLRGLVMVLMALDHVRDYFMLGAMAQDPMDMQTTTPALYFTRWITHFCAPTFVLLSGMSAFIAGQRKSKAQLAGFLFSRGVWLLVVEVLVVTLGLTFDLQYRILLLQVIWAIGLCFILLAGLIFLPRSGIGIIGLLLVATHNVLDPVQVLSTGWAHFVWSGLHEPNVFRVFNHTTIVLAYPFLPWLGIMCLGYYAGGFYLPNFGQQKRHKILLLAGTFSVVLLVALRFPDLYGDSQTFTEQKNWVLSAYDFFNVTKYPPSLHFTLMTVGPALLLLVWLEKAKVRFLRPFTIIGQVPFFYYIAHIYLLHCVAILAAFATGFSWQDMPIGSEIITAPKGFGFSLPVVYVFWLLIVLCLYPLCAWYARYKAAHKQNKWLSYF
jgi:uncharacterized membrane protein